MEPAIPANSLVVTRRYDPGMPLQKGEIIAFSAQRFGESVVVLHRFSHTETTPTGRTLYRTHPEKSTLLDSYEVTQEEILGVYLFHIPRLGRLSLFLKSPFGLLWGCEMVLILLANSWIRIRSNPV